jgi:hypothetical protein
MMKHRLEIIQQYVPYHLEKLEILKWEKNQKRFVVLLYAMDLSLIRQTLDTAGKSIINLAKLWSLDLEYRKL